MWVLGRRTARLLCVFTREVLASVCKMRVMISAYVVAVSRGVRMTK